MDKDEVKDIETFVNESDKTKNLGFKLEVPEDKKEEFRKLLEVFGPQSKEFIKFMFGIIQENLKSQGIKNIKLKEEEDEVHKVQFERGGGC